MLKQYVTPTLDIIFFTEDITLAYELSVNYPFKTDPYSLGDTYA